MSALDKLNEKQRKFVMLYVTQVIPAGRCYEVVGYSARGRSADQAASRLLKNVNICEALKEIYDSASMDAVASLQETLEFLTLVMRTPLSEIGEDSPLCLEFSETVTESGTIRRVKKIDPLKAAQELSRLKNRYAPQKIELGADDGLTEILEGLAKTGGSNDKM